MVFIYYMSNIPTDDLIEANKMWCWQVLHFSACRFPAGGGGGRWGRQRYNRLPRWADLRGKTVHWRMARGGREVEDYKFECEPF